MATQATQHLQTPQPDAPQDAPQDVPFFALKTLRFACSKRTTNAESIETVLTQHLNVNASLFRVVDRGVCLEVAFVKHATAQYVFHSRSTFADHGVALPTWKVPRWKRGDAYLTLGFSGVDASLSRSDVQQAFAPYGNITALHFGKRRGAGLRGTVAFYTREQVDAVLADVGALKQRLSIDLRIGHTATSARVVPRPRTVLIMRVTPEATDEAVRAFYGRFGELASLDIKRRKEGPGLLTVGVGYADVGAVWDAVSATLCEQPFPAKVKETQVRIVGVRPETNQDIVLPPVGAMRHETREGGLNTMLKVRVTPSRFDETLARRVVGEIAPVVWFGTFDETPHKGTRRVLVEFESNEQARRVLARLLGRLRSLYRGRIGETISFAKEELWQRKAQESQLRTCF